MTTKRRTKRNQITLWNDAIELKTEEASSSTYKLQALKEYLYNFISVQNLLVSGKTFYAILRGTKMKNTDSVPDFGFTKATTCSQIYGL